MPDELQELNERFYSLYGRLYENSELLTKKQTDYIAACLYERYKTEYELLSLRGEITDKSERFAIMERRKALIPRRWRRLLFWKRKNRAADILIREIEKEVAEEFAQREQELEESSEMLEVPERQEAEDPAAARAGAESGTAGIREEPAAQAKALPNGSGSGAAGAAADGEVPAAAGCALIANGEPQAVNTE